MADLTAKSAYDGLLPIEADGLVLSEVVLDAVSWVAPFKGKAGSVSKALDRQTGAVFPEPNRMTGGAQAQIVWFGPDQALVLGPALNPIKGAAMADQTGAWAICALEGDGVAEVLARLVPVDLRDGAMDVGHGARTLLGHMSCVLMRTGKARYEIMVFRSMAATCAHEIEHAMRMVTARDALAD